MKLLKILSILIYATTLNFINNINDLYYANEIVSDPIFLENNLILKNLEDEDGFQEKLMISIEKEDNIYNVYFADNYWSEPITAERLYGSGIQVSFSQFNNDIMNDIIEKLEEYMDAEGWIITDYEIYENNLFIINETPSQRQNITTSILDTLGNIAISFGTTITAVFTAAISLFYDDGLTIMGTISLISLGTGLLVWAIAYIRRLIRIKTRR